MFKKALVECNICFKRGDGDWAGFHREYIGHNDFSLVYGEDDEPPPKSFMGIVSGFIPTPSALAERFKGIWRLWSSDWSIYPIRSSVSSRRNFILTDI